MSSTGDDPFGSTSAPKATSGAAIGVAGAERLSLAVIWAYASPRIAFGIMGTLFGTYLMKFATDTLLIAPAAMGTILAASRLWDAISDPMVGYLSDRTRSRFGRRRAWMFFAAIPMSLALVAMWSPPLSLDDVGLVVWMAVALLLYETASTGYWVPHGAAGVELTPNHHERTRLFAWSHVIGAVGMVVGLGALQLMHVAEDKRLAAFALSTTAGLCVAVIVLWSTWRLPERADYQGRGGQRLVASFLDVFRNRHARLLFFVYAIETFGAASVGMLVPYLVEYVVPMQDLMVPLLLAYTVPQFVFVPLWVRLAQQIGKKKLWLSSMVLTAACFAGFLPLDEPSWVIWMLAVLLGVAAGCGAVVAPSIKADVIDYDEFRTGERKEGAYLALWNLVRKSAASATAFVTGWVLQASGFEPNVEQTEEAKFAIQALFSLLPASCYFIGALAFARFQFNEKEHAEVRAALAERARST